MDTILKPLLSMGVSDKCVTRTSAQMQALSKERLPRLEGTMINSHTRNQGCSIHTAGAEKLTGVSTFPEAAATWSEGGVGPGDCWGEEAVGPGDCWGQEGM